MLRPNRSVPIPQAPVHRVRIPARRNLIHAHPFHVAPAVSTASVDCTSAQSSGSSRPRTRSIRSFCSRNAAVCRSTASTSGLRMATNALTSTRSPEAAIANGTTGGDGSANRQLVDDRADQIRSGPVSALDEVGVNPCCGRFRVVTHPTANDIQRTAPPSATTSSRGHAASHATGDDRTGTRSTTPNARVIRSGDHGTDPSNANSCAHDTNPSTRPSTTVTARSYQVRQRTNPPGGFDMRQQARRRLVFVGPSVGGPPTSTNDLAINTNCRSSSTSDHRKLPARRTAHRSQQLSAPTSQPMPTPGQQPRSTRRAAPP